MSLEEIGELEKAGDASNLLRRRAVGTALNVINVIFHSRPLERAVASYAGLSKSRWAVFSMSMDTVSDFPPLSMMKTLGRASSALNGSSKYYGRAKGA